LIHNCDVRSDFTNGAILKLLDIDGRSLKVKLESTGAIQWLGKITRNAPFSSFKRTQYPVTLVFASTIHKVQSLTVEASAIHFSDFHSHGLLYVATSRVKRKENLYFFGFNMEERSQFDIDFDLHSLSIISEIEKE
jgi:hypothetical protein